MKTETPKFVLKPNLKSAMLPTLIMRSVIVLLFLGFFFAGFLLNAFILLPFTFIFLLISFFSIIPSYFDYRNREYRFFADKLEYVDGWWAINRHVVPYTKVTDIVLRQQIWNRIMGTGTIELITAGSLHGNAYLVHLDNPEKIYDHLQKEVLKL